MRPTRTLRFCFVVVCAIVLTFTGISAAYDLELPSEEYRWIKVETPNVTLFANTDEKIARRNAQSLEQLWAVLARDFDGVPRVSPIPTSVFVFDFFSDAFIPYGPLSKKGKPKKSGGYFISRQAGNYAAIVERDYRFPNRLDLYHDCVHAAVENFIPELPLWLEEGLAEYYSVFHIEHGEARLGYRINRHIARLRNRALIPLAELFAIDRSSPEYDENDRTGMFYAESWLLTHMLLTERPNGRLQAMRYAELLRQGVDRDAAFTKAFQTTYDTLETQLKKYVRARSHHYKVFPLSTEIVGNTETTDMARTEVLFRLGDLLASGLLERFEFAAEHFKAVLELDDGFGPAYAGLGLLEEASGREERSLDLYERAAELTPDDARINLLLGRNLFGGTGSESSDGSREQRLRRARTMLRRATDLQPEWVEPWAELGLTFLTDSDDREVGIDALEHAMQLQPKRPDVGIALTTLYVKRGRSKEADSVVARMEAAGVDSGALERARVIAAQSGCRMVESRELDHLDDVGGVRESER